MSADDAVNHGAIGAVIGHEISHGFDDQGSQFDGEGNLRNWWSDSDHEAFSDRTRALIEQYAAYEPVAGHTPTASSRSGRTSRTSPVWQSPTARICFAGRRAGAGHRRLDR